MKRLKLLILFSPLLALCSFTQDMFWYRTADYKLKGKVKTIYETSVCLQKDAKQPYCFDREIYSRFNQAGNLTEDSIKGISASSFQYSKAGDTVEQHYKIGALNGKLVYVYSAEGKKLASTRYYEKKGKWIKLTYYTYSYTTNTCEQQLHTSNAKLLSRVVTGYDDAGRLITESVFSLSGKVKEKTTYEYDSRGNRTKVVCWNRKLPFCYTTTRTYDDKGNSLEEIETNYSNQPKSISYQYEYDATGNWIKLDYSINGVLQSSITRKIEYY